MEKKTYLLPLIEVIEFTQDDVLCDSLNGGIGQDTNCNGIDDLFE